MAVTPTAWAVDPVLDGDDGDSEQKVLVVRDSDGDIGIEWFCGDERTFAPDTLRATVRALEGLRNGVNIHTVDPYFYGRVDDQGVFVADDEPVYNGRGVLWAELKEAIDNALGGTDAAN